MLKPLGVREKPIDYTQVQMDKHYAHLLAQKYKFPSNTQARKFARVIAIVNIVFVDWPVAYQRCLNALYDRKVDDGVNNDPNLIYFKDADIVNQLLVFLGEKICYLRNKIDQYSRAYEPSHPDHVPAPKLPCCGPFDPLDIMS